MASKANRRKTASSSNVSDEVRAFLSENGRKGGNTTKRLIELGREAAAESGEDVQKEVQTRLRSEARREA